MCIFHISSYIIAYSNTLASSIVQHSNAVTMNHDCYRVHVTVILHHKLQYTNILTDMGRCDTITANNLTHAEVQHSNRKQSHRCSEVHINSGSHPSHMSLLVYI